MRHLIAAILLAATVATALPRHIVMAIPVAKWESQNPSNRKKIEAFFRRFCDPKAAAAVGTTRYDHPETGEPYYVCAFWTEHLTRYSEHIDAAKIADAIARFADPDTHIAFTDDPRLTFATWGLVAPVLDAITEGN